MSPKAATATSDEKAKKPKGPLWTTYRVTWEFPGNLCASVPKDPELIKGWLDARKPEAVPKDARTIDEINAEVVETMLGQETPEETEQRVWLGFQTTSGHLVMGARTIRGHLKDCARILSTAYVGRLQGERAFSTKVVNGAYPVEYWIPILRPDGSSVMVPDGFMDKAVHVRTPQGQRNALKRFDFVTNVKLVFHLKVLFGLTQEDLGTLMQYGGIHGYAGERSEGEGRYLYTIDLIDEA